MNYCCLCGCILTSDSDSKEHIFPASIGGKRTVTGFICKECNNRTGKDWDSVLFNQLHSLCLLFMIKRDKKPVASRIFETTSGEKLQLNHDGTRCISKPNYQECLTEDGKIKIDIQARNVDEARRMVKDLHRRKYPQIDVDQFLNKISDNASYSTDLLKYNISFGGELSGRSIVKTALAFAYDNSISSSDCECAMSYLLNEKGFPCFGYYYQEKDLISNRPIGIPLHCVAISGNPETGLLVGYIEYFSVYRIVVCLSENYTGKHIDNSYSIDPRNGNELSLDIRCTITIEEIHAAYIYEKFSDQVMRRAFTNVLDEALKTANRKESERVFQTAFQYAWDNCGAVEGKILESHHIARLSELFVEKYMLYVFHLNQQRRKMAE